jgi:hypothetical protein
LGVPPDNVEGAVPLNTELIRPNLGISRPDCVFKLADGSIHVIEFQSTARYIDVVRFAVYLALLAFEHSTEAGRCVPVSITVVYSGGIGKRPQRCYPDDLPRGAGFLQLKLNQIVLDKRIDMAKVVRKVRDANESGTVLSQDQLVELLFAPLGRVPVDPVPTTEEYFNQMRILSEKTRNPNILTMAYLGVSARGGIATAEMMKGFQEVLIKMGANVYQLADDLTLGEFSKVKAENASKDVTIKSQDVTIKSQAGKLKSQDVTIKSQAQEIEDLKTAKAVLAMRTKNMSPEEIALKQDLRLSEVHRILDAEGGDA